MNKKPSPHLQNLTEVAVPTTEVAVPTTEVAVPTHMCEQSSSLELVSSVSDRHLHDSKPHGGNDLSFQVS